jgi:hypothetical protein
VLIMDLYGGLVSMLAAAGAAGCEFVLEYAEVAGRPCREPLVSCAGVPFERAAPCRRFGWPRGASHFPGWWYFETTGELVGFESWLERDWLMVLDADPAVVGVAAQPFWLCWHDGARQRRHAPDFFARMARGQGVVVDVRPDELIALADAEAFTATAAACALVGWEFRRLGAPDRLAVANLRWLSRYRHPRCGGNGEAARCLVDAFAVPGRLLEVAGEVGDPIAVLPVLFHLLWHRRLSVDLVGVRLGPSSLVGPPVLTAVVGGGS